MARVARAVWCRRLAESVKYACHPADDHRAPCTASTGQHQCVLVPICHSLLVDRRCSWRVRPSTAHLTHALRRKSKCTVTGPLVSIHQRRAPGAGLATPWACKCGVIRAALGKTDRGERRSGRGPSFQLGRVIHAAASFTSARLQTTWGYG